MNLLHLTGYGVKVKVNNLKSHSELQVTDGREDLKTEPLKYTFRPRRIPYDSIIIDGHSGYISLQAFHWLSKNNIPVFILNFDGSLISSILPPAPVKADIKTAQIEALSDEEKRFNIAYALIKAKLYRTIDVLQWMGERYDLQDKIRQARTENQSLFKANTVNDIRITEGRVASRYWQAYQSVIPECFDFQTRMTKSHQNNASDPVNLTRAR